MHDSHAWTLSFGRWGGVHVRVHAFFLLFAIVTFYLSAQSGESDLIWYSGMGLAILLASVVLHELGHCYAALHAGGSVEEIVLGPLGGLTPPSVRHEPQSELITALAGPAVNLTIALVILPLLLLLDVNTFYLLNPLRPHKLVEGTGPVVALKLAFWLNWILVLVNLLPAFPFDGGRVLRAVLWPWLGYRAAITLVGRFAIVAALGLCLLAYLLHDATAQQNVPAWVPLSVIALCLIFSAKQEAARLDRQDYDEEMFGGYDFSQGYTSLERDVEAERRDEPGLVRRWLEKRREEKDRLRREQEIAEEARVDAILAELHTKGLEGLSIEDRALLERVAARYRNRQKG